jgi:hypothetical protein
VLGPDTGGAHRRNSQRASLWPTGEMTCTMAFQGRRSSGADLRRPWKAIVRQTAKLLRERTAGAGLLFATKWRWPIAVKLLPGPRKKGDCRACRRQHDHPNQHAPLHVLSSCPKVVGTTEDCGGQKEEPYRSHAPIWRHEHAERHPNYRYDVERTSRTHAPTTDFTPSVRRRLSWCEVSIKWFHSPVR